MAIETRGDQSRGKKVRAILDSAIQGGLIDAKMSIRDVLGRLGPSIDEVAGYALAWDKYVLVVAGIERREDIAGQASA